MFGKTNLLGVCLALSCHVAPAQTIDEISDLNRQAAIAEAKARLAAAQKSNSPGVPSTQGSGPQGPVSSLPLPQGMASSANAPTWTSVVRSHDRKSPPSLIAIYGVGTRLIAELGEGGFEAKYREGDKTPSGWTIARIDKRNVDLTRPNRAKGKASKVERVSLPFGTKAEIPGNSNAAINEPTSGKYGMPPLPLPTSYPAAR